MVPFSFKSERAYSFVPCIKFQVSGVRCQVSGGRSQKPEARIQKSGGRESREEREGLWPPKPLSSEALAKADRRRRIGEGGLREEGGSAPLCVSVSLWPIHAGCRLN
jgi:hypothetical protein